MKLTEKAAAIEESFVARNLALNGRLLEIVRLELLIYVSQ